MNRRMIASAIGLALLASGCQGLVPQVTPTVAPTRTPIPIETAVNFVPSPSPTPILLASLSPTPEPSATLSQTPRPASSTPTLTSTASASPTRISSATPRPSHTPTLTPIPSATPTPSQTPRPSLTPFISPTPSATASVTPSPSATYTLVPSVTPTLTATPSATLTFTPSATYTPLPSLTPTLDGTRIVILLLTRQAQERPSPTPLPSWTPNPLPSATSTLAPTFDVTPTFITPTPDTNFGIVFSSPTFLAPSPTPIPVPILATATPFSLPTPLPTPIFAYSPPNLSGFSFSVAPNSFRFNGQTVGGDVRLFAANPVYAESYARTDANGGLYFAPPGGGEGSMTFAPFYDGYSAGSAESNKNFVREIAWAPNGWYLAFLIDPPAGTDDINAGVWFWQPAIENSNDPTYRVAGDCRGGGNASCQIMDSHSAGAWYASYLEWSPDSTRLLMTYILPQEGRQGVAVRYAVRDANYSNRAPAIFRYDWATWLDNERLLVSGRLADGSAGISIVPLNGDNLDMSQEQRLFNASANGMWIQSAAYRADGVLVGLGRIGDGNGAMGLYRIADGRALSFSGNIGGSAPQRVEWTNDRRALVVQVDGVQYLVDAFSGVISAVDTNRVP